MAALQVKDGKWQVEINSPGETVLSTAHKYLDRNIDVTVEVRIWDGSIYEPELFLLDLSKLSQTSKLG